MFCTGFLKIAGPAGRKIDELAKKLHLKDSTRKGMRSSLARRIKNTRNEIKDGPKHHAYQGYRQYFPDRKDTGTAAYKRGIGINNKAAHGGVTLHGLARSGEPRKITAHIGTMTTDPISGKTQHKLKSF